MYGWGSNFGACDDTLTIDIVIGDSSSDPCAQLNADFTYSVSGNDVSFTNVSTGMYPGILWDWTTGDGDYYYLGNPNHTYNNNGNYTVCLTLWGWDSTQTFQCADTICKTINIVDSSFNSVLDDDSFAKVNLFPNPAIDFFNLNIESNKQKEIEISILNLSGKIIETKKEYVVSGSNEFHFSTINLAKGVYLIQIKDVENGLFEIISLARE